MTNATSANKDSSSGCHPVSLSGNALEKARADIQKSMTVVRRSRLSPIYSRNLTAFEALHLALGILNGDTEHDGLSENLSRAVDESSHSSDHNA